MSWYLSNYYLLVLFFPDPCCCWWYITAFDPNCLNVCWMSHKFSSRLSECVLWTNTVCNVCEVCVVSWHRYVHRATLSSVCLCTAHGACTSEHKPYPEKDKSNPLPGGAQGSSIDGTLSGCWWTSFSDKVYHSDLSQSRTLSGISTHWGNSRPRFELKRNWAGRVNITERMWDSQLWLFMLSSSPVSWNTTSQLSIPIYSQSASKQNRWKYQISISRDRGGKWMQHSAVTLNYKTHCN